MLIQPTNRCRKWAVLALRIGASLLGNLLHDAYADGFETATSQAALFRDADVLSLHLKLIEETHDIVTQALLAQMKPSALLVNTGRAELIEFDVLEAALRTGRPGCAGYLVHPLRTRSFEKRETREKRGVNVERERAWFLGEGCRGAVRKCSRSCL
jgi:lactate dehydrogenase-like 2-hydroxyacid dehydrogenase